MVSTDGSRGREERENGMDRLKVDELRVFRGENEEGEEVWLYEQTLWRKTVEKYLNKKVLASVVAHRDSMKPVGEVVVRLEERSTSGLPSLSLEGRYQYQTVESPILYEDLTRDEIRAAAVMKVREKVRAVWAWVKGGGPVVNMKAAFWAFLASFTTSEVRALRSEREGEELKGGLSPTGGENRES